MVLVRLVMKFWDHFWERKDLSVISETEVDIFFNVAKLEFIKKGFKIDVSRKGRRKKTH